MALGYESALINGQLVPVAPAQAFDPLTYGSVLSGPGYWPRNGQWNLPPLMPNATATSATMDYSPDFAGEGNAGAEYGGMPTAGSVNPKTGKMNFLHPTKSPVWWTIGLLGLSLFLLHKVHYGK